MDCVNILMATYNGERFLKEQTDSILRQKDVKIDLLVRDDGSTDGTPAVLSVYQNSGLLRLVADSDKRLGPARSFMRLLRLSSDKADYYAFADQDDFWQEDKTATAVRSLQPFSGQPALYFSRTMPADEHLTPLTMAHLNPRLTFGESLVHEFVSGCTIVMNKAMRDLINLYEPAYLPMHDVWVYCVAQAVAARIVYDPVPHMLYRQHGSNVVGTGGGVLKSWQQRWHRFSHCEQERYRRAVEIRNGYDCLVAPGNRELLRSFTEAKHSMRKRLALLFNSQLGCSDKTVEALFRINLLLNRY